MSWRTGLASLFLAAAMPLSAYAEQGDFMLRVRGIAVTPQEDADIKTIGGDVDIDTAYVPEVDISYFLTDHLALELIAASPRHEVTAINTAAGSLDLGHVRLLPPTLTLQYHFMPESRIKPYVGAGINYTVFYNERLAGGGEIDYDDSFGFALQAGIDFNVRGNWYVNVDAKKVWLETSVDINNGAVTADVEINPLIVGGGIGYRF